MTHITLPRDVVEQALEALLSVKNHGWNEDTHTGRALIATLRSRLAQPEQEPVQDDLIPPDSLFVCGQMGANVTRVRLAEPVQEPVSCKTLCELCVKRGYTFCANAVKTTPINTPPQRKPLTEEQINLFINGRGEEEDDDYVEPTGDGFGLTDADLVLIWCALFVESKPPTASRGKHDTTT